MKVTYCSKYSKCYVDFENAIKFEKRLMVFKIIAFELVAGVSVNYEKNACDRPSTC